MFLLDSESNGCKNQKNRKDNTDKQLQDLSRKHSETACTGITDNRIRKEFREAAVFTRTPYPATLSISHACPAMICFPMLLFPLAALLHKAISGQITDNIIIFLFVERS